MNKLILFIALIQIAVFCQEGPMLFTQPPACKGHVNTNPILYTQPSLVKTIDHGKRYSLSNGTTNLLLGVFEGTPYEVGHANGVLFAEEIAAVISGMVGWVDNYVVQQILPHLPKDLQWIGKLPTIVFTELLYTLLDSEYLRTWFFTPERFEAELRGIGEGSGVLIGKVKLINLFPELIRADCSIAGAWGPATQNGNLLQLRALDWNVDLNPPMAQQAMVTIYHFKEKGSNPFANFGWAGMVGALAGFSPKVGISERFDHLQKQNMSAYGEPWMYVLRDLLQFSSNLSDSVKILENVRRTWGIWVGVGSAEDNQLYIFQYSAHILDVFDWQNMSVPSGYSRQQDLLYIADHDCIGGFLGGLYGNLTQDNIFRQVAPQTVTGDELLAVYDFTAQTVLLSFADYKTGTPAYYLSPTFLNMTELFSL